MNKSWQPYRGIYCFLGHWTFSSGAGRDWLKGRYHWEFYLYTQLWKHFWKKTKKNKTPLGRLRGSEVVLRRALNYFLAYHPSAASLGERLSSNKVEDEPIRSCHVLPFFSFFFLEFVFSGGGWQKLQLIWRRHQTDPDITSTLPDESVSRELSVLGMMKDCAGHTA